MLDKWSCLEGEDVILMGVHGETFGEGGKVLDLGGSFKGDSPYNHSLN